eukprot:gene23809-30399_t
MIGGSDLLHPEWTARRSPEPIPGSDHRTEGERVRTEAHAITRRKGSAAGFPGYIAPNARAIGPAMRPLISWDHETWNLANGLDMSRLTELTSGRTLTLIDMVDDLIVRRFAIRDLYDEAAVEAFKQDLRRQYGLDNPASTLVLRDSAPPLRKRR